MKPLTTETRKHIVKDIRVRVEKRGSFGYPLQEVFSGAEEPEEVWVVSIRIQEGMLPEITVSNYLYSQQEADDVVAKYPIGSEYPYYFPWELIDFDDWVESGFFPIRGGDEDLYLPWKILMDAGVTDEHGLGPSRMVMDFLGDERIKGIKSLYGENWVAVAEFEYCFRYLSHSSPAYLAATTRFCYFILENDFKAGYLLRDLEVLVHGVEATATSAIETRKRAGASGSKKSRQARETRRANLFDKIELIATRNPDAIKFGPAAISRLALDECVNENPAMWKQGAGQVLEYLGEIRRGEAGQKMQMRYNNIFGDKPLKR